MFSFWYHLHNLAHSSHEQSGPFMDIDHKLFTLGKVGLLPEVFFRQKIVNMLTPLMGEGIQVVLIPSLSDMQHSHFVYPQAPFDKTTLGIPEVTFGRLTQSCGLGHGVPFQPRNISDQ